MQQREAEHEKYVRMTTAPIPGLVGRLAGPGIAVMLISSLYSMADTFFVGTLGTSATAAVGVVYPLMAVIQALGFFFGHGSGNFISRALGAQKHEQASRMAATGFVSSFLGGAVVAAAGLAFSAPLARLLGATPTILPHAQDYMLYILLAAPFLSASLTLNNLLRYQGSAFYGMVGMVSGAVLNVALDPLFIFVFRMGVGGAALATALSQAVSFGLLLVGCARGGNIRIRVRDFSPSLAAYREIIRGGLPSLCRQALASVASVLVNQLAGGFGDAAIAALAIVQRVGDFAASALIGLGQGCQPVCGFNYGAKKYQRVREAYFFCVKVGAVGMTLLAAAGALFAPQVVGLFRNDAEVVRIGAQALRFQCLAMPLTAWVTPCSMLLQVLGRAGRASLLAVARQGLFLVPILFTLTPLLGLAGLVASQPLADAASFVLALPLGIGILRELAAMERRPG